MTFVIPALSQSQRRLSQRLIEFKFECIGNRQTDDELVIAGALKEFGKLISAIEDEKDRMVSGELKSRLHFQASVTHLTFAFVPSSRGPTNSSSSRWRSSGGTRSARSRSGRRSSRSRRPSSAPARSATSVSPPRSRIRPSRR